VRKAQAKPGLRMNQLVEATGLPKSTLAHYVREGLLPEPTKTSRNMAYYPEEAVSAARLIRGMKEQGLSLPRIRTLLAMRARGYDPAVLLELNRVVFGEPKGERVGIDELCASTSLKRRDAEELVRLRLLLPLEGQRFDEQDQRVGKVYALLLEGGVQPGDLAFYAEKAREIVEAEMALRREAVEGLTYEEDAERTTRLVHGARAIRSYVLERVFQHSVQSSQSQRIEELALKPRAK